MLLDDHSLHLTQQLEGTSTTLFLFALALGLETLALLFFSLATLDGCNAVKDLVAR